MVGSLSNSDCNYSNQTDMECEEITIGFSIKFVQIVIKLVIRLNWQEVSVDITISDSSTVTLSYYGNSVLDYSFQ